MRGLDESVRVHTNGFGTRQRARARRLFWLGADLLRHKLTLEAEAGGETHSASSVVENGVRGVIQFSLSPTIGIGQQGEALYLDLGPKCRPLIALLGRRAVNTEQKPATYNYRAGNFERIAALYGAAAPQWRKGKFYEWIDGWDAFAGLRGAKDITPANLPDLVTFADINDPKTVMEVDAANPGAALNCDFKWKRITIEVTDEPVTTGIEKKLAWLEGLHGSIGKDLGLDAGHLLNRIHEGVFWQGIQK